MFTRLAILIAFILQLTAVTAINAQIITFENKYGGPLSDYGYCIRQTPDGGYIVAGSLAIDALNSQAVLLKLDHSGTVTWQRLYGDNLNESFHTVNVLENGYIAAGFSNSGNSGKNDIVVCRTNPSGVITWAVTIDGPKAEPLSVTVEFTHEGNFMISAGFVKNLLPEVGIIALVSNNGKRKWARYFYEEALLGVTRHNTDRYAIAGIRPENDQIFSWIEVINNDGCKQWREQLATGYATSLLSLSDDGFIIGGIAEEAESKNWVPFLLKLDSEATVHWNKTYSAIVTKHTFQFINDESGGFVFTSIDFNTRTLSEKLLLLKTDRNGEVLWKRLYGKNGMSSRGTFIQPTNDGGYIVTGITDQYGDKNDIYVLKTDSEGKIANRLADESDKK